MPPGATGRSKRMSDAKGVADLAGVPDRAGATVDDRRFDRKVGEPDPRGYLVLSTAHTAVRARSAHGRYTLYGVFCVWRTLANS
jgi:hypothetical protein